jgi:DinB family protein
LLSIREAVTVLERTPRAIGGLLEGMPDSWSRFSPSEGVWSAYDIVGHLIHGEKTDWMQRIAMILEHGTSRPFEPFDREAMFDASAAKRIDALLAEFASLREQGLRDLAAIRLGEAELSLEGLHPALGRVTLAQLIAAWAVHDLGHLAQIGEAMAKRYRTEIGPWRAYLPIVDRPDLIGD